MIGIKDYHYSSLVLLVTVVSKKMSSYEPC